MMDNYGLLCLDIAWTYFKLKDPAYLKEAGWRLKKVESVALIYNLIALNISGYL